MSDEYINKKDVVNLGVMMQTHLWTREQTYNAIFCLPSADVAPVRHAKWLSKAMRIMCSDCGAEFNDEIVYMLNNYEPMNYCPACGAKMDGGDDNEIDRR